MVEWKKLGEVCEVLRGRALSKKDVGQGDYPIILYGELYTTYGDYIDEIKSYTSQEKASEATKLNFLDLILPVSSTTKEAQIGKVSVVRTKMNVSLGSDAIILRNSSNPSFLMYYLNSKLFEQMKMNCVSGTTIMHLSPSKLVNNKIPIPSLSEQERIVGILDTFTATIDNLKAQIAQRRKQYEYYRDQLLDLEGKPGVEMKTLGKVCEIRGRIGFRGYTRDDQVEKGAGAISLSPGNITNGIIDYESCTYITWEKYEESPEIMTFNGDIILCKTASVGKVAMVIDLPEKATINPQLVVLKRIKVLTKYMYYVLSTFKIQTILKGLAGIGSVPNVSQAKLAEVKICVPSNDEQQRIVTILDTFESSIRNLEAQLKQREQQYEYYRNKLLTFE